MSPYEQSTPDSDDCALAVMSKVAWKEVLGVDQALMLEGAVVGKGDEPGVRDNCRVGNRMSI